jgi:hypothetical protein
MMVYYNSEKRNEQGRLCSCESSTHTTFCTAPFMSQNIRLFTSWQTMMPQQSAMDL